MAGNLRQNAGPPEVELLATGAEYRDTRAECRPPEQSTGTQEQNAGQRELNRRIWEEKSAQLWGLRAFTICFAAWATLRKGTTLQKGATLLPGPPCRTRLRAGPDAAGRRLVELVLDEELDGLVFCHSEFVVEDCGVVVSLLCAEPEFSLV